MSKLSSRARWLFLALFASASLCAQNFEASQSSSVLSGIVIPGSGSLLWDNTQIASSTNGIISLQAGDFPAGANQVNVADDFIVPAGTEWSVDFVFSEGFTLQLTEANAFGITFYSNNAGVPGEEIASRTVAFGTAVSMSTQLLPLATPVVLDTGTYWISVYAIYSPFVDLDTTRWNWASGTAAHGSSPASLQDTGAFFGAPMPWSPLSNLGINDAPSTFFALRGSSRETDADVSLQKTASAPVNPSVGDQATFTLVVSNAGPGIAEGVSVVDTIPATLTYVSDTCGAAFEGSMVTWTVGTLAVGGNASCNIVTTFRDFGTVVNVATVSSISDDPLSSNNSSSVTISGATNTPMNIPALEQFGLILLGLLLAGVAVVAIRR